MNGKIICISSTLAPTVNAKPIVTPSKTHNTLWHHYIKLTLKDQYYLERHKCVTLQYGTPLWYFGPAFWWLFISDKWLMYNLWKFSWHFLFCSLFSVEDKTRWCYWYEMMWRLSVIPLLSLHLKSSLLIWLTVSHFLAGNHFLRAIILCCPQFLVIVDPLNFFDPAVLEAASRVQQNSWMCSVLLHLQSHCVLFKS